MQPPQYALFASPHEMEKNRTFNRGQRRAPITIQGSSEIFGFISSTWEEAVKNATERMLKVSGEKGDPPQLSSNASYA